MSSKPKDITGKKFGKLIAVSRTDKKGNNGSYIWLFKCDCGNFEERSVKDLTRMKIGGKCRSCFINKTTTHGCSYSQVYNAWRNIKARCFNPKTHNYSKYGGAGITMQENWINDFVAFRDYIGNPPEDGNKYSIDRVDNLKGYEEGNIRWATKAQQNRNRSISFANTSGVTGVSFSRKAYVAYWYDLNTNLHSKTFSVKKYGEELAFFMACEYREQMINLLNLQGAGYSENHGK